MYYPLYDPNDEILQSQSLQKEEGVPKIHIHFLKKKNKAQRCNIWGRREKKCGFQGRGESDEWAR
jgi:hypothetical protein